ncbi:MAG TPA: energy transducer TonB [Pyrinomonadaceae bacterium]|nr:energy transducer TonB [Pyrinomonadaceae bacterium]
MHPCLLKKLLPFALTFIVGATIGGLFKSRVTTQTSTERTTLMIDHNGYGHSCRMYRRDLVAETKPLVIFFKPDALLSYREEMGKEGRNTVSVNVTFGADGKVQKVENLPPLMPDVMKQAVERAARQIQFTPEIINSVPITVTREVEIHFMTD